MAFSKFDKWGGIWKSIRTIDPDSNGFVGVTELEEIFKEWFPVALEGKSCQQWFRQFCMLENKNLVNYKQIKERLN